MKLTLLVLSFMLVLIVCFTSSCGEISNDLNDQINNLNNKIEALESRLVITENIILSLSQDIGTLESKYQSPISEYTILKLLQGKDYWVNIAGLGYRVLSFGECLSIDQ